MPTASADLTASVLAQPRSARLRLVSVLLAEEKDAEGAADYEAAARDAEMDEAPEIFTAKGSHAGFIAKLRADLRRTAGRSPRAKKAAPQAA
jgi:hypothetical protein